jgi:hypothetical protein
MWPDPSSSRPRRVVCFVLSNHWHFVVWPQNDGQVTNFFRWLAHTHGDPKQGRSDLSPVARKTGT